MAATPTTPAATITDDLLSSIIIRRRRKIFDPKEDFDVDGNDIDGNDEDPSTHEFNDCHRPRMIHHRCTTNSSSFMIHSNRNNVNDIVSSDNSIHTTSIRIVSCTKSRPTHNLGRKRIRRPDRSSSSSSTLFSVVIFRHSMMMMTSMTNLVFLLSLLLILANFGNSNNNPFDCVAAFPIVAVTSYNHHHHDRTEGSHHSHHNHNHHHHHNRHSRLDAITDPNHEDDYENNNNNEDVTPTTTTTNYHFRDSWSVITLGDLHMEDDMTYHEQAREDCMNALRTLPLLATTTTTTTSSTKKPNNPIVEITQSTVEQWEQQPVSTLCSAQLELLLERQKVREEAQQQQSTSSNLDDPTLLCKSYMVSLGDLGRKDIRHEPGDAGTTKSFVDAKQYFDGFFSIGSGDDDYKESLLQSSQRYEVVSGNHDLEGLDEFDTDHENLQAWMDCFSKSTPYFARQIGERTLLVGLSTVRFRDAPYSSHECYVDDDQLTWFEKTIQQHPASDGWKVLVFSHAPIIGSGLRVLQNVHVTNGCAWLNHCSDQSIRNKFIRIVQSNPQIKVWSSGHFHLSHDYEDSVRVVETAADSKDDDDDKSVEVNGNTSKRKKKKNRCVFLQVGVIGPQSCRDGNRQTRLLRGSGDCIEIYTINHHIRVPLVEVETDDGNIETKSTAELRLDATIDLRSGKVTLAEGDASADSSIGKEGSNLPCATTNERDSNWFQAYVPRDEDGCYIDDFDGSLVDAKPEDVVAKKVCWWHMADGKVLGLHSGQLIEYDEETLSPLGVVVTAEQLRGREIMVVQNKTTLVLVDDDTQDTEVIHPNQDGSYWRKFQRNKKVRLEEKAREEVARRWFAQKKGDTLQQK